MPSPTPIGKEKESLETENAQLRARIEELEHPAQDLPFHAFDTADRLARGFTYALVEELQTGVDSINAMANKFFGKSPKEHYEQRSNVLSDLASGLAQGAHEALNIPRRAMDRFFTAFHEEQNGGRAQKEPPEAEETTPEEKSKTA